MYKGKEITYAFSVAIPDVPTCINDAITNFADNEHLTSIDVKCGFDNETGEEIARVFVKTFVGDLDAMKPKRC